MKKFWSTFCVWAMLSMRACVHAQTSPAAPANWTLRFADDFARTEIGGDWGGGKMTLENGALKIGQENELGSNFVVCLRSFAGAQRLEYDAMAPTDRPCDLSAVLNGTDAGYASGFLFGFGSQMNTLSQLMFKGQKIRQYERKIIPHKWHHIVCQREGARFIHIIDGQTVLDYTHPEPLPGPLGEQIGFYVWHVALIDNVKVYTKPEQVRVTPAATATVAAGQMAIQARAYPAPGKIVVSVDIPSWATIPNETPLQLQAILQRGGQIVRKTHLTTEPQMREEIIWDAGALPRGDYTAKLTLRAPERLLDQQSLRLVWPGRSPEFRKIKILNNFVWELINRSVPLKNNKAAEFSVHLPCDRWLFVRSALRSGAPGQALVRLNGAKLFELGPQTSSQQAMRYVKAGAHRIRLEPVGSAPITMNLLVRAVPEIQHSRYPTSVAINQGVSYDWEFLRRHILPYVNTIITMGEPNETVWSHLRAWKEQGGKIIQYGGRPGFSDKALEASGEIVANSYASRLGYTHPLLDGILVDEFYHKNDPSYPALAEGVRLLNKRFPGKAFYPYAAGSFGKDEGSLPFAQACLEGGGYVCWEAYLAEWPTLKLALTAMRRYLDSAIIPMEENLPGILRKTIWVFGVFSFPWPYADGYAHTNYNAYLDMQFQMIATHPALFGLGGVHIWRAGYCDEERLRLFGQMFRHYCIEGQTSRLYPYPYLLTHIENPDFAEGTKGWTLDPAAPDSLEALSRPGMGKFLGRYYRGPDTFLVSRREAGKANVFSQQIRHLEKGRTYSVKMLTGNYEDLEAGKSARQIHPVSIEIQGAEILSGSRYNYQEPFPTKERYGSFTVGQPFWLNYHWRVFRATDSTAMLRLSDAPAAPGQQILYTYIEVKPYIMEGEEDLLRQQEKKTRK